MISGDIQHKPWTGNVKPKKILAIRFQALGDLMITLPYLQSLREQTPGARIHLLTRKEVAKIPQNLALFEKVFTVGGGRNAKIQFLHSLLWMPFLVWQGYDIVVDLQNHRISSVIRKLLMAKAWSEFDRESRILAGERTRLTLDALGLALTSISTRLELKNKLAVEGKLKAKGWDGEKSLITLNPAGAFVSRQWPRENYAAFARRWLARHPASQFLILGTGSLKPTADFLKSRLADDLIDLTGDTSLPEAFAVIKKATFMLTEDSGLMHMAWVQGVPTLALFGSSPSYWSAPHGAWSRCLNSSDLPCGDCFSETCKFGDVHCLTRRSPEEVVEAAENLLKSLTTPTT